MGGKTLNRGFRNFGILGLLLAGSIGLACCGGSSPSTGMGTANVTISDPPSNTQYSSVWVTIDGVDATTSTSDSGWEPLVSDVSSASGKIKAVQVNLLKLPANGQCLLAQLGSTSSLPAGDYEQIRLMLVPNNATNVTLESPSGESTTNQCSGVDAWNCAMPSGGTMTALDLSSEAQTGLKIPPGQVMGGPINVASGKSVDINVDFNADRSIVPEGTSGRLGLDPVLLAYQTSGASVNTSGISGQVVEGTLSSGKVSNTSTEIEAANVALEMSSGNPADGSNSVDLIGNYLKTTATNGNFDFCPLPQGPFDLVVSAGPATVTGSGGTTSTDTYGATIIHNVSNGTQVTVPVLLNSGGAAELTGEVKDTNASSSATSVTNDLYAIQPAASSMNLDFAVPLLVTTNSDPSMVQFSASTCSSGTCTGTYQIYVPASNPLVGDFSAGSITWTAPASSSPFDYQVEATCTSASSSSSLVSSFSANEGATAGSSTSVPTLTLSGCQ